MNLINILKDEEIVANGCKCIRICLREDKNLEYISKQTDGELVNSLIELLPKHILSEYVY